MSSLEDEEEFPDVSSVLQLTQADKDLLERERALKLLEASHPDDLDTCGLPSLPLSQLAYAVEGAQTTILGSFFPGTPPGQAYIAGPESPLLDGDMVEDKQKPASEEDWNPIPIPFVPPFDPEAEKRMPPASAEESLILPPPQQPQPLSPAPFPLPPTPSPERTPSPAFQPMASPPAQPEPVQALSLSSPPALDQTLPDFAPRPVDVQTVLAPRPVPQGAIKTEYFESTLALKTAYGIPRNLSLVSNQMTVALGPQGRLGQLVLLSRTPLQGTPEGILKDLTVKASILSFLQQRYVLPNVLHVFRLAAVEKGEMQGLLQVTELVDTGGLDALALNPDPALNLYFAWVAFQLFSTVQFLHEHGVTRLNLTYNSVRLVLNKTMLQRTQLLAALSGNKEQMPIDDVNLPYPIVLTNLLGTCALPAGEAREAGAEPVCDVPYTITSTNLKGGRVRETRKTFQMEERKRRDFSDAAKIILVFASKAALGGTSRLSASTASILNGWANRAPGARLATTLDALLKSLIAQMKESDSANRYAADVQTLGALFS